ncbi:hypothetical protein BS47DRAFT_1335914 [Hydnum rufescens UP504]|uniref:CRAL-TRIO domain-containing protein n=1 Tax=Hydnum rufescens UP504 TaxID=1448309 RepID=A0A9P6B9L7_9AGAM|nr:hypothetical protein BS47DRAFT_1335914 [Hydnum rufescens UP504]
MSEAILAQRTLVDDQFKEHLDVVLELQQEAVARLKELIIERNLDGETAAWCVDSLDITTVFRFLKKHKFSHDAALLALVANFKWRLETLPYQPPPKPSMLLRFLPPEVTDPFGRPILVVRARYLPGVSIIDLKNQILTGYELARLHIAHLFRNDGGRGHRVLQFVVILDLQDLPIHVMPMELVPWFGQLLIPQYPGMCGTCYVVNYSWTYAGLWSVFKRLLPQRALSRVFFPSLPELQTFLPLSSLPKEYGGHVPPPSPKYDAMLRRYLPDLSSDAVSQSPESSASSETDEGRTLQTVSSSSSLSPSSSPAPTAPPAPAHIPVYRSIPTRSSLNTFFGYPAVVTGTGGSQVPKLSFGRRRKRDLARTLFILLLQRIGRVLTRFLLDPFALRRTRSGRRKWRFWVWWSVLLWMGGNIVQVLRDINGPAVMSLQALAQAAVRSDRVPAAIAL